MTLSVTDRTCSTKEPAAHRFGGGRSSGGVHPPEALEVLLCLGRHRLHNWVDLLLVRSANGRNEPPNTTSRSCMQAAAKLIPAAGPGEGSHNSSGCVAFEILID